MDTYHCDCHNYEILYRIPSGFILFKQEYDVPSHVCCKELTQVTQDLGLAESYQVLKLTIWNFTLFRVPFHHVYA
jgi:hypothetical protein